MLCNSRESQSRSESRRLWRAQLQDLSLADIEPDAFKREMREGFVARGFARARLDKLRITLRAGSVIASVRGLFDDMDSLRRIPLHEVQVCGCRPEVIMWNIPPIHTPSIPTLVIVSRLLVSVSKGFRRLSSFSGCRRYEPGDSAWTLAPRAPTPTTNGSGFHLLGCSGEYVDGQTLAALVGKCRT